MATSADIPKVGTQVFVDANRNGILDNGETVTLTDDSGDGLWILDLNSGAMFGFVELPTAVNSGAAAVGGDVFVLSPLSELIHKVAPITQSLVQSFDINAIYFEHPDGPFDMIGYLCESLDGTELLVKSDNQLLSIDPDTGIVVTVSQHPIDGSGGADAADGERYLARASYLDVVDDNQVVNIRQVPMGYQAGSIAVAVVPGTRHLIHSVADTDATGRDFLVRTGFSPSDISLSANSINENVDTSATDVVFAELSTVDASPVDSHAYELVGGDGDDDNARFQIDGDELKLLQGEVLDYETKFSYLIRLRSTDTSGQSHEQEFTLGVNDLVESLGVVINDDDQSASRSRITSLRVEFDGSVSVASDAFTILNRTTEQTFGYSFDKPTIAGGKTVVVLSVEGAELEGGSLADGNYELTINATKVTSLTGAGLDANGDGIEGDDFYFGREETDMFYRLFGDASGDRSVGLSDFATFRAAFGSNAGDANFDETLDSNDDGSIGLTDFASFRGTFGDDLEFDL